MKATVRFWDVAAALIPYAALASTDFAAGAINPLLTYLTPNDSAFANVSAVQAGAVAVGNVFNGWLTGVVPARFQLAVSLLICGAANALTPAVAKSYGLLLVIRALANFTDPWSQAQTLLDPDGSSPGVTGQAVAAVLAGRVVGSLLGGYIVDAAGETGTCLAIGASIAIVGLCTLVALPTGTAEAQRSIGAAGSLSQWARAVALACGCTTSIGTDESNDEDQAHAPSHSDESVATALSLPRVGHDPDPVPCPGAGAGAGAGLGSSEDRERRTGGRSSAGADQDEGGKDGTSTPLLGPEHGGASDGASLNGASNPGMEAARNPGGGVATHSPDPAELAHPWPWAQQTLGPYGFFLAGGWWMHCLVLAGNGLVCGAFNTSVLYVLKSSYGYPLSTSSAILGADTAVRALGAGSLLPIVSGCIKEPNLSSLAAALLAGSLAGVALLRPPLPSSKHDKVGDSVADDQDGLLGGTVMLATSPMVLYVLVTGLAYTLQSIHHSSALACANAYVHSADPKVRGLVKGSAFFAMMVGIVAMSYSALRVLKVDSGREGEGGGAEAQRAAMREAADGRMRLFLGLAAAMAVCGVLVRGLVPVDFDRGIGAGAGAGAGAPVGKRPGMPGSHAPALVPVGVVAQASDTAEPERGQRDRRYDQLPLTDGTGP